MPPPKPSSATMQDLWRRQDDKRDAIEGRTKANKYNRKGGDFTVQIYGGTQLIGSVSNYFEIWTKETRRE